MIEKIKNLIEKIKEEIKEIENHQNIKFEDLKRDWHKDRLTDYEDLFMNTIYGKKEIIKELENILKGDN